DSALAPLDRLLAVFPDDLKLHYQRGLVLAQGGAHDRAIAEFLHVLEREPAQATTHRDLGLTYHLAGQYGSAAQPLERALALRPDARDRAEIRDVVRTDRGR